MSKNFDSRAYAESFFKNGSKPVTVAPTAQTSVREKSERLKALRLAREAEQNQLSSSPRM